ncbi:DUF2207 domain-containing protein [Bacillus toyonensis]|uniref:DUF2207 domain-containing protein n=1 Tax=Bacillus toyonensis TaxID=155322 RepID=UPI0020D28512|nr:DUF2207 domain-containing protein [Bacillus toyonensis]
MAGRIKGITISIDGETTGLQNALKDVNKQSDSLAKELKDVERLLKFNPGNVEALAQKQKLLTQQIENTTQKLDKLKAAEQQVQAQFQNGKISEEQYRSFRREIEFTQRSLDGLKNKLGNMKTEQESVANSTRQLETLFHATGKSVDDFAGALGNRLVNAIKSGTATSRQLEQAIGLIGREVLGAEADIEKLQRVLRSVDDGNSIQQVRNELRDLQQEAQRTQREFKELDIGLENVLGAMVAGGGIAGTIEQALDMSKLKTKIDITFDVPESSKKSVEEAVRGVTAYGVDAEASLEGVRRQWALNKGVSDEANAAVVKGAAAISQAYSGIDFNELIQETHEIANELGLTDDAALVLTNSLLKVGFPPEQLDIIAEYGGQLTRAGYNAEEVQAIMEAGVETGTWNIDNLLDGLKEGRIKAAEFGQGVDKAMKETLEGTNISAEQLQKWGEAVANGGREGSAAMTDIALALSQVEDETKRNELGVKLFGTMYEDQGQNIINTLLGAKEKTIDFKQGQDQLNDSIKKMDANPAVKMQKALGDLKMALEPVLSVVADLVSKFAEWVTNNPELAATLATIAVAIGIISGAIMALAPIVVTVMSIFGIGAAAASLLVAAIPLIVAAIAAIGIAIYKNWDSIKQWTIEIWNSIKEYLIGLWDGIVQSSSEAWNSFLETMHAFFEPIGEFFSSLWSGIVETASSWWSSLVTTASEMWATLVQSWQETWNTILTVLDPIISFIATVLDAGWLLIQAGAQIAWAAISQYMIQPIQEAYNWVSTTIGEMVTWLGTQWEAVKSYTSAAWSLVKQYVIQPVQELWNTTKEKLNDLANWILSNWDKIKTYTLTAWNLVKQYVIQPVTEAYNSAKEKFENLYNSAKEKFDAAKRNIIDPIKEAVGKVEEFIGKIKGFFEGLNLKIPKPEMPLLPHFSLQTSTKNVLGKDVTYPSGVNIDWRAKGGIFTKPTIFGMNGGNLQGAGEAGPEAVLPLNKKTLGAIGEGIASTMIGTTSAMNQLVGDMSRMMDSSMEQLSGLKTVMTGVYGSMSNSKQSMVSDVTNQIVQAGIENRSVTQPGSAAGNGNATIQLVINEQVLGDVVVPIVDIAQGRQLNTRLLFSGVR